MKQKPIPGRFYRLETNHYLSKEYNGRIYQADECGMLRGLSNPNPSITGLFSGDGFGPLSSTDFLIWDTDALKWSQINDPPKLETGALYRYRNAHTVYVAIGPYMLKDITSEARWPLGEHSSWQNFQKWDIKGMIWEEAFPN